MSQLNQTDRTTITRLPARGSYDMETILSILKEGLVCHVSLSDEGKVYTLPNLYAVKDNKIFIHGSVGSFMLRTLKKEVEVCLTVTLVDGIVMAKSAFHHSMNYRSVVVFGKATTVEGEAEKMEALEALTEHIIPGRWNEVRLPNASELKKTLVLSIPIEEASAKIRTGGPNDDEEDMDLNVWAGVLPLKMERGSPIPPHGAPEYVKNYKRGEESNIIKASFRF